ncbi:MAG: hypothetical protein ABIV51_09060 [Saprospiraceae bacterium]
MSPFLRNVLTVLAGVLAGGIINIGIIFLSGYIIPLPAGADVSTMEGLKATMHLLEPKHFIMPFLAHAIGTFFGAFIAARIAKERKMRFAYIIGLFFLIGGIANALMLPAPIWYIGLDLMLAYIPMAYLAGDMTKR